eukprot:TRINITY_DN142_c0_g1_i1.p1 TRINITY_DN142_c0_g1~~TRINITY_DN142_c0_g1_i1.p1  ORF type:complete len:312 (-),score=82.51 TRINITY_DN142_c0_g1_i1:195-1097(-)
MSINFELEIFDELNDEYRNNLAEQDILKFTSPLTNEKRFILLKKSTLEGCTIEYLSEIPIGEILYTENGTKVERITEDIIKIGKYEISISDDQENVKLREEIIKNVKYGFKVSKYLTAEAIIETIVGTSIYEGLPLCSVDSPNSGSIIFDLNELDFDQEYFCPNYDLSIVKFNNGFCNINGALVPLLSSIPPFFNQTLNNYQNLKSIVENMDVGQIPSNVSSDIDENKNEDVKADKTHVEINEPLNKMKKVQQCVSEQVIMTKGFVLGIVSQKMEDEQVLNMVNTAFDKLQSDLNKLLTL